MGETLPLFTTTFNASLLVEARPERLTGDAGAVLLREALERSRIIGWLTERLVDPRQPPPPRRLPSGRPAAHHAHPVRPRLVRPGRRRRAAARSRPAARRRRRAGRHAAGGGQPPRLAADALPPARRPDPGGEPAGAARGAGRTRRPPPARRARRPAPSLPDHRRRRSAGRGPWRAARLGLERPLPAAHVPPDPRLRGRDRRHARRPPARSEERRVGKECSSRWS